MIKLACKIGLDFSCMTLVAIAWADSLVAGSLITGMICAIYLAVTWMLEHSGEDLK